MGFEPRAIISTGTSQRDLPNATPGASAVNAYKPLLSRR